MEADGWQNKAAMDPFTSREREAIIRTLEAVSSEAPAKGQQLDAKAERMKEAGSPRELARSCSRLFGDATAEQLRQLVAHPHRGVALAAGWERVRRTLPKEKQEGTVRPNERMLSSFLELVEGRTQVPLPRFWEYRVQSARS